MIITTHAELKTKILIVQINIVVEVHHVTVIQIQNDHKTDMVLTLEIDADERTTTPPHCNILREKRVSR